ncbi:Structural maintenance of chromosomes protein 6 [Chionoecetes opilio]|uniref:Structural maintenance of chromosomes protein 6 n=1 Tax=Chionoecetes opilio TaxID=41210 RepID=A0A8J5CRP0_CHIOP|nr:Structural maintenance of chromosomes protein 6 [Chionoecetes opilio]
MKEKQLNEATKNFEDVAKEVREMEDEMKYAKSDYKDKQGQFLLAEKKMRAITSEISTLREAMEKDNSRAHREWAAARALWQNKIDGVENQVKELLEHCKTETTHLQNLQNTLEVKMSDKRNQDVEERAMRKQLNDLERELKGLQCQKGGQLTVYGHWVPQLLNKIQTAFARGLFVKKPVGPMGAYIKVRDNKWAHVAERVLGKRITGFCVDNQADEKVLRNLMKEIRFDQQAKPIVIVARFRDQVLDVSKFEAFSPDYPSLWSIFDISDSVVANTVVDQMQAESILLIPTSQEAGNLLKDRTQVPRNCKCAYTLNLDQYYPDPNYRVYGGRGSHRAKFLQVSVQDRMREVNRSKEECTERLNSFFQHNQEAQRVIKNLQEEITASNKKSQQYKRKMDTLRMTLGDLQNQETPPLPNIAQLEEDVRQQEESLTVAKANMEKIREESNGTKVKYSELSGFLIAARQREKKSYKEVQTCKRVLDQANANSAELQIKTHKKRKAQLIKEEKNHEKAVAETTEVLDAALKIAENLNIGPRIETQKNIKELERQYNCLQTRLNKERASSGDPVTIAEKYMTTKHRFRQVSEDLNKHVSLMKKLKESLQMRESKYWRLNKWLAVIIKYFFKEHLSLRKLDGSIYVNFDQNTLNIHVEKLGPKKESPVKDMNNKKTRKKAHHQDLIMMSGGERSFATVAFINALWHAIVSPVHILDEFDVFMDVIARNRAMKMMISAAKPDTQYIFLTPLSLDTNKFSSCSFFRDLQWSVSPKPTQTLRSGEVL